MANPGSLHTANDSCDCHQAPYLGCRDTSFITATLICMDGCPVAGGIVTFTAEVAGQILPYNVDTTDVNGQAACRYMIRGCDIPCDDNGCSVVTIVRAALVQNPSIFSTVEITCSRPPNRMR